MEKFMKLSLLLIISMLAISCGRKNPQTKIKEETKKALEAKEAEDGKKIQALEASSEESSKLLAIKDAHIAKQAATYKSKIKALNGDLVIVKKQLQEALAAGSKPNSEIISQLNKEKTELENELKKLKLSESEQVKALKASHKEALSKQKAIYDQAVLDKDKEIETAQNTIKELQAKLEEKPEESKEEEEKSNVCDKAIALKAGESCEFNSFELLNILNQDIEKFALKTLLEIMGTDGSQIQKVTKSLVISENKEELSDSEHYVIEVANCQPMMNKCFHQKKLTFSRAYDPRIQDAISWKYSEVTLEDLSESDHSTEENTSPDTDSNKEDSSCQEKKEVAEASGDVIPKCDL